MCGDGANDAPALRQAQMGIAVSTATDVAKSAAGVVLTNPGLTGIVAAVKEGRITFQRILTYTLNSVTKKIVQVLLLGVGLVMTGHAILTPMLMIIVMMAGDFLGMSLTTDNVRPSLLPNSWRIGKLTIAGIFMGVSELVFCVGVLAIGHFPPGAGIATLQTLAFFALVCGNQATMYAVRARGRIWSSPHPSRWLVLSSVADLVIALTLAGCGWLMAPLPLWVLGGVLAGAIAFAFVLDLVGHADDDGRTGRINPVNVFPMALFDQRQEFAGIQDCLAGLIHLFSEAIPRQLSPNERVLRQVRGF
jgi:H+-transporting ATPase